MCESETLDMPKNKPKTAAEKNDLEIRKLRLAAGLTQQEVAAYAGVSYQAVHNWESGDREPNRWIKDKLFTWLRRKAKRPKKAATA